MSTATARGQATRLVRWLALARRRLAAAPPYVRYVYALVLVWGLGDAASTLLAAGATGTVEGERNPVMAVVLAADPLLLVLVKAAVAAVAALALLSCRDVVESVPGWRAWFVGTTAAGSLVVCNNLLVAAVAVA